MEDHQCIETRRLLWCKYYFFLFSCVVLFHYLEPNNIINHCFWKLSRGNVLLQLTENSNKFQRIYGTNSSCNRQNMRSCLVVKTRFRGECIKICRGTKMLAILIYFSKFLPAAPQSRACDYHEIFHIDTSQEACAITPLIN